MTDEQRSDGIGAHACACRARPGIRGQGLQWGVMITLLVAMAPATAQTLASALESALKLDPQIQTLDARRAAIEGQRLAVEALTPAPPTVVMSHSTDLVERNDGRREWEAGVEVPLWSGRERAARRALIDAQIAELDAETRVLRLSLAGELRERAWQAAATSEHQQRLQQRLDSARALERDVARRVDAGELARVDWLSARTETLSVEAELSEASIARQNAVQGYRVLIGVEPVPMLEQEREANVTAIEEHPRLAGLRKRIEVAQGKRRVAQAQDREPIEVGVFSKSEREAFGSSYRHVLKVEMRIPLPSGTRNDARVRATESDLAQVMADYTATRIRVLAEVERARSAVTMTRTQLEGAGHRVAVARENLGHIEKAFSVGERGVVELLRVRARALEAAAAEAALRIDLGRAVARLNQALGVLP